MTPYRIRSERVSERRRRGTSAGGLAGDSFTLSKNPIILRIPLDTPEVAQNAKTPDVEHELRSQIDRAKKAGIPVTHLDMHMAGMVSSSELFGVYGKLQGPRS